MAICFGGYEFSEPVQLIHWVPPSIAGLYAILIPDNTYNPRPFRVIYFGETKNYSERGFIRSHHKYSAWLNVAGSEDNLYVSTFFMVLSPSLQRVVTETYLINEYRPVCNS